MMKNNELKLYELNSSQDVVKLQCKYTLFKRVINIITSATTTKKIDLDVMTQALNKVVERNDCLRIQFVKKGGKLMQQFRTQVVVENVPYFEFKTEEEQNRFFLKIRKSAIKYMKGVVFEPYFCKTYDNKFMIVLKVCHLILDMYGINNVYKDIFEVYDALKNNKELPAEPTKFEDIIIKDLKFKNNEETKKKNTEFFTNYLKPRECPQYAGIHGLNEPIWQNQIKHNKPAMKMFFIKNDTEGYLHKIDKKVIEGVLGYCQEHKYSIANVFFFVMNLTLSKMNGNTKNMLPLELCNCRATVTEKKCAGTKVQSIACYTSFDYEKTFEENMSYFAKEQTNLYRYIGFSDVEFEMLLHKIYKYPLLGTFYPMTFSLIPFEKIDDVDIQVYSNGKFALPAYVAMMWDIKSNDMVVAYDVQTKIISEQNVADFHENYVKILKQITKNSDVKLSDIKF